MEPVFEAIGALLRSTALRPPQTSMPTGGPSSSGQEVHRQYLTGRRSGPRHRQVFDLIPLAAPAPGPIAKVLQRACPCLSHIRLRGRQLLMSSGASMDAVSRSARPPSSIGRNPRAVSIHRRTFEEHLLPIVPEEPCAPRPAHIVSMSSHCDDSRSGMSADGLKARPHIISTGAKRRSCECAPPASSAAASSAAPGALSRQSNDAVEIGARSKREMKIDGRPPKTLFETVY